MWGSWGSAPALARNLTLTLTWPRRQMGLDASSPRRPKLELEGYSLTPTASGLSVLVPTGTRKVTACNGM